MKCRFLFFLYIGLTISSCKDFKDQNQYGLSHIEVRELVCQYADALDSLAQVMPIIGGDTESTWAAEQVSNQRNTLMDKDFSLTEGLAASYRMHNYISYGLTYFQAIIGLYGSAGEFAGYAMNMISVSDSLYNSIAQSSYTDMVTFEDYYANTFFYAQLYGYLYNAQNEVQVFSENGFGHSLQSMDLLDEVEGITPEVRFKMGRILEGASFFHAYCSLINGLATTQEQFEAHKDILINHATYFDEKSNEVYLAIKSKTFDTPILSDTGFALFMKESIERKVWMLRRLAEEIRVIENQTSRIE